MSGANLGYEVNKIVFMSAREKTQELYDDALGDGNMSHVVACWVKQEVWMVIDR
jgi:hypothetical protein